MSIRSCKVNSYTGTVLHRRPLVPSAAKTLFVWIPGNPGILEYYEQFLTLVQDRNPTWAVLAVSHAGLAPEALPGKVFDLQEQIDHKIQVINRFTSAETDLVIMGHSVGAYMVQQVVLRGCDLRGNIKSIGLITPTLIDIHRSSHGTRMTRLFAYLPEAHVWLDRLSSCVFNRWVPRVVTEQAIKLLVVGRECKNLGAIEATYQLLTRQGYIQQVLGLASHEMDEIRSNWQAQAEFVSRCNSAGTKIIMRFCDNDHWIDSQTRKALIGFYNDYAQANLLDIKILQDVPHSFVLNHARTVTSDLFE